MQNILMYDFAVDHAFENYLLKFMKYFNYVEPLTHFICTSSQRYIVENLLNSENPWLPKYCKEFPSHGSSCIVSCKFGKF